MGRGWLRRRKPRKDADRGESRRAEWKRRQEEVMTRDGWRCRALVEAIPSASLLPVELIEAKRDLERCQRRDTLQTHHLLNRSQGGSDHPDNLLTLCYDHHEKATRRMLVYFQDRNGFLARAWVRSWETSGLP